jgi:hypothetical protein
MTHLDDTEPGPPPTEPRPSPPVLLSRNETALFARERLPEAEPAEPPVGVSAPRLIRRPFESRRMRVPSMLEDTELTLLAAAGGGGVGAVAPAGRRRRRSALESPPDGLPQPVAAVPPSCSPAAARSSACPALHTFRFVLATAAAVGPDSDTSLPLPVGLLRPPAPPPRPSRWSS